MNIAAGTWRNFKSVNQTRIIILLVSFLNTTFALGALRDVASFRFRTFMHCHIKRIPEGRQENPAAIFTITAAVIVLSVGLAADYFEFLLTKTRISNALSALEPETARTFPIGEVGA
jgi:hypothetical protein